MVENGAETRQERREKKQRKQRERMKMHGKGLTKVYLDSITKRLKRQP
jgi:hypothetical protein